MKKVVLTVIILVSFVSIAVAQEETEKIRIHGKLTYFDGRPVVGGNAFVMNKSFQQPMYMATTNDQGEYEIEAPKGEYIALVLVKMDEWAKKNVETWVWNLLAYEDLEINARIGTIELYAINVFRPQGGYPSLFVYFRPMSLKKYLEQGGAEGAKGKSVFEIAPELTKDDIEIFFNEEKVDLLEVNRVKEGSKEHALYGYLVQTELPKAWKETGFFKVHIVLTDKETGEVGESFYLIENYYEQYK